MADDLPEADGIQFPATPWSSILKAADADTEERRQALSRLLASYWKPIYCSVRFGWQLESVEARNIVLAFFAHLLDQDVLQTLDPGKTRFRDFLKERLGVFLAERTETSSTARTDLEFDLLDAETLEAQPGEPLEVFDREWMLLLFRRALRRLETRLAESGDETSWMVFRRRDVEGDARPRTELAEELGIPSSELRSRLLEARRLFRRIVTDQVCEYAFDDTDARKELEWTLG